MPSRSLLTLNQDVLSEILAHVLLDTPCELHRTSVLRTCSTLHELGLPKLYAVVDLTGYRRSYLLERQWKVLFGMEGLLAERGGRGRWVKELRLGRDQWTTFEDFAVPTLYLPNCCSLHLDICGLSAALYPALPQIILQLPVKQLSIGYSGNLIPFLINSFGPPLDSLLGLASQPWPSLRSVTFEDTVWYDRLELYVGDSPVRISFSLWSFRTLFVRHRIRNGLALGYSPDHDEIQLIERLLNPSPCFDQSTFLRDTERIELRIYLELEQRFRKVVEERGGRDGLSAFNRRIAGMMVFVDEDGTERKLLE